MIKTDSVYLYPSASVRYAVKFFISWQYKDDDDLFVTGYLVLEVFYFDYWNVGDVETPSYFRRKCSKENACINYLSYKPIYLFIGKYADVPKHFSIISLNHCAIVMLCCFI